MKKIIVAFSVLCCFTVAAWSMDTEVTRETLKGLPGVYVVIEDFHPNILKHDRLLVKAGATRESLKKLCEDKLTAAGIRVLNREEWLQTPGRPILCIAINTHESERYVYAFDAKVYLMQLATLDANPKVRTMAETWSINITGQVNIGNLNHIRDAVSILIDRFISARKAVN